MSEASQGEEGTGKVLSPRLRAVLDTIPVYVPRKPAVSADGTGWKLSSNENPYPPLPGVLEALTAAAGQATTSCMPGAPSSPIRSSRCDGRHVRGDGALRRPDA